MNVRSVKYRGLFPRAEVQFGDPALPVNVTLHAWSPLIPRNVDDSAIPAAVFDFAVANRGADEAVVEVAFAWPNVLGVGGGGGAKWDDVSGNYQRPWAGAGLRGLVYKTRNRWQGRRRNVEGEYVLAVSDADRVAHAVNWDAAADRLALWAGDERPFTIPAAPSKANQPAGALVATVTVPPGGTRTVRFVLAWYTPHLVMVHSVSVPAPGCERSTKNVAAAIDGDSSTRWTTGRAMLPGDGFELRWGKPTVLSRLEIDMAASPNDWPRGLGVYLSRDGQHWERVARLSEDECRAEAADGVVTVSFPPFQATVLRLRQLGRTSYWWWSIHELRLIGPDGRPASLDGAEATAYLRRVRTQTVVDDVGHWYQRRFNNARDVARYVAANAERLLSQTRQWQNLILSSTLPGWLKVKLINDAFTMYAATVLTRDGRFSVLESPVDMGGALGTMDQRMAAHAFYTQMFPELDKSELRLFAQCQQADGRITHFCGNVHQVIGDPNVGYGVTDWPDLSCSFVMQVVKLAHWLADRDFLEEMWPAVQRAMDWLASADEDGDLIPEGGSTYDYERLPRGAFIYSASCYLGALLAAERAADALGDDTAAAVYRRRFRAVRESVMRSLWNGRFFAKWNNPATGEHNPNSFVAALAGDWLARLCGLGDTLPPGVAEREVAELIRRHLNPFFPIPPMEVTPRGLRTTGTCFVLQHEPYLGCEAIYRGFTDAGLEVLRRVYVCGWEINKRPWLQSLSVTAPEGAAGGLQAYMTNPASWHVLNALSGLSFDGFSRTLYISPRMPGGSRRLAMPVFVADFWLWLEWVPGRKLELRVLKAFGPRPHVVRWVAADGNAAPIQLPEPFVVREGARLDLTPYEEKLGAVARPKTVAGAVRPPNCIGLDPSRWRLLASASGPTARLEYAIDRQPATRWSTGQTMGGGEWLAINLGAPTQIAQVWIWLGDHPNDWPRGLRVEASDDGRNWRVVGEFSEAECKAMVRDSWWRLPLEKPITTRWLRLVQLGREPKHWWSVHELYLLPPGP